MTNPVTTTVASAIRDLAARDDALPDLALILDSDRRAESLGAASTIERLRYKPGASVIAAVRGESGDLSWIVTYSDAAKLHKSHRRAEDAGALAAYLSPRVLTGPVHGDRLLARAVQRTFATDAAVFGGAHIIRYNPLRRLVLRDGDRVLKLTATRQSHAAAAALSGRGLPVLAPERIAGDVWSSPWWGDGDLATHRQGTRARLSAAAGAALHGIHATPRRALHLPALDAKRAGRQAASAIARLLPALSSRAHRVAAATGALPGPLVVSHGDWSEDQVLTDGDAVRIIDLDRACLAPREYDIGRFLASGGSSAMLTGYRAAGGDFDTATLARARALALLQRAVEPFRLGSTTWPQDVERILARAETALDDDREPEHEGATR